MWLALFSLVIFSPLWCRLGWQLTQRQSALETINPDALWNMDCMWLQVPGISLRHSAHVQVWSSTRGTFNATDSRIIIYKHWPKAVTRVVIDRPRYLGVRTITIMCLCSVRGLLRTWFVIVTSYLIWLQMKTIDLSTVRWTELNWILYFRHDYMSSVLYICP